MESYGPDMMTERAEIAQQLDAYKTADGKLKVPQVLEEIYIQQVISNRRLNAGAKKMEKCKVLKGEMTFDEAHYLLPGPPPLDKKKPKEPEEPKIDEIKFTGKTRMKTIILIIIVIAAIAIPGGVAALILKVGGLP